MGDPNLLAYLALLLWVPVAIGLFLVARPSLAAIWLSLAGCMFLPERTGFIIPVIKPVDKNVLTPLLLFLCFVFLRPGRVLRTRPGWPIWLCVLLMFFGEAGTVLTNGDRLVYGATVLPALTIQHDLLQFVVRETLTYIVPFFIGYWVIRSAADLRLLLRSLVLAGMLYSLFIFIELRFSPQLHAWIYGFHQHDFVQVLRGGGYRPMVFMYHGITVARFMAATLLAAIAMAKAKALARPPWAWGTVIYLGVVLLLCKSMGAVVYVAVLVPVLLILRSKNQLRIASLLVLLACAYPLARATHTVPIQSLVQWSASFSADRAQSLGYRFENDEAMLARALERPWFGWGGWDRNRVYSADGAITTIPDGSWVIMLGVYGILGWAARFGLLVIPVWRALSRLRRVEESSDRILLAALAGIVAMHVVDLLPNSMNSTCELLFPGALLGATQALTGLRGKGAGIGDSTEAIEGRPGEPAIANG